MDSFVIPQDMNDQEMARKTNSKAVVSIRDMLVLLGTSDKKLREIDAMDEIRATEPWRDGTEFVVLKDFGDMQVGYTKGQWHYFWTPYEYLDINHWHLDDSVDPNGVKSLRIDVEIRRTDCHYNFVI